MTTFVLVHGAWGGAHGFRHVRKLLQAAGHEVTTPSLTGIGERVHLTHPLVNLSTHVRDVVNHVLYEDLRKIVLLGFSYGGCVVTGALEHIADRVRHLVFLDAFVPKHGDTAGGLARGTTAGWPKIELGDDWLLTGPARDYDDPAEAQWMAPRRTTHPKGCFSEPCFWRSRWRTFHSPAPTSRPPQRRRPIPATPPSGRRRAMRRPRPRGSTSRSPLTTWWPTTGRRNWLRFWSRWPARADSYQLLHRASRDPRRMKRACNTAAASGTEVGLYLVLRARISVGPAASRAPRTVAWGLSP